MVPSSFTVPAWSAARYWPAGVVSSGWSHTMMVRRRRADLVVGGGQASVLALPLAVRRLASVAVGFAGGGLELLDDGSAVIGRWRRWRAPASVASPALTGSLTALVARRRRSRPARCWRRRRGPQADGDALAGRPCGQLCGRIRRWGQERPRMDSCFRKVGDSSGF